MPAPTLTEVFEGKVERGSFSHPEKVERRTDKVEEKVDELLGVETDRTLPGLEPNCLRLVLGWVRKTLFVNRSNACSCSIKRGAMSRSCGGGRFVRDDRGIWRYGFLGQPVSGAQDMTLNNFFNFPTREGEEGKFVQVQRGIAIENTRWSSA